jgi:hypothetical protein
MRVPSRIGSVDWESRSIWNRNWLAARSCRQGRQNRVGTVSKKSNGAICQEKMSAAAVQAPEVKYVTLLVNLPRTIVVWPRRAMARVNAASISLSRTKDHV